MLGSSGVNGTLGLIGVLGSSGVNGSLGLVGVLGSSGVNGSLGLTGVLGSSGVNGSLGLSGVLGSSGINGSLGLTGVLGSSGVSGSLVSGGTTTGGLSDGAGCVLSSLPSPHADSIIEMMPILMVFNGNAVLCVKRIPQQMCCWEYNSYINKLYYICLVVSN